MARKVKKTQLSENYTKQGMLTVQQLELDMEQETGYK